MLKIRKESLSSMCGFVGLFTLKDPLEVDEQLLLEEMSSSLIKRGPDHKGHYFGTHFSCIHHRLSIIDPSEKSHQPISRDGVILCFNGEIYNYRELGDELNIEFSGDTQVLLEGYLKEGENFFHRLNGMFAMVLYDTKNKTLFLARDRFGIKPLFYKQDKYFKFSSTMTPLLSEGLEVEETAVWDYFSFGYIPGEKTAYQDIYQVPSNTLLKINAQGISKSQLFPKNLDRYLHHSDECKKDLEKVLESLMQNEAHADVPVGVMLSSGLDSGALLYFLEKIQKKKVKTYSIGFDIESFDESKDVELFKDYFLMDHHPIKITANKVLENFDDYLKNIEQPFADGSALPTMILSKEAAKEVKVLLSGEGGDEVFGGYLTYQANLAAKIYNLLPGPVKSLVRKGSSFLPVSFSKLNWFFKIKRFVKCCSEDELKNHLSWREIFSHEEKIRLLGLEYRESLELYRNKIKNFKGIQDLMELDREFFLKDDLLVKCDRMTMAHSIEARVPFLNNMLVDFMDTVQLALKVNLRQTKILFRDFLSGKLPPQIVDKKKMGLEMPYSYWFQDELKDFMLNILNEDKLLKSNISNVGYVKNLIDEHLEGKEDHGRKLWALINYVAWYYKFILKEEIRY